MVNHRLSLYDYSQSPPRWVDIPIAQEIPVDITLNIADVREPENVKASSSKTVTIPFSKEANQFFEFIYQANIDLQIFNPNWKTPARYYVNERLTFRGDLQLIKIVKFDTGTILTGEYQCNILGYEASLFVDVGEDKLEDLDYSDLNHNFTWNADDVFTPTIGEGYAYAFINYGFPQSDPQDVLWKFTDLKCLIFEREYLSRIFSTYGYEWDSNFLDSNFFRRLIMPDVNEGRMKQDAALIADAEFYAVQTADQNGWGIINSSYTAVALNQPDLAPLGNTLGPGWIYNVPWPLSAFDPVAFTYYDDDFTPPYFDGDGIGTGVYNPANGRFTTNLQSWYEIGTQTNLDFSLYTSFTPASMSGSLYCEVYFLIQQSVDGGTTWNTIAQTVQAITIDSYTTVSLTNQTKTIPLNIGVGGQHRGFVVVRISGALQFFDGSMIPITTGASNIIVDFKAGSTFYAKVVNSDIQYGQLVNVGQTVTRDFKIKDYLKSLIQRFNLRIEPSKENPRKLIIEPYDDFYSQLIQLDWTDKIDVSQPIEYLPMGELQGARYIFKYKEDKDVWNEKYQEEFKESYGQEIIEVDNDFIKNDKVVEVALSNTPAIGNVYNSLAVPHLHKVNNSNVNAPMKCNPRSLYWGGMIGCTPYTFDVNGTQWDRLVYPYVGFVDDPSNPQIDLSFDNPFRLYYTLPAQNFTNNNYYNRFWKRYIDQITDKNSKIIRCKMYLDEVEIANFTFRSYVWIIDSWYIINKIEGWNPLKDVPCTVEALKLQNVSTFEMNDAMEVGEASGVGGIGNGGLIGGGSIPSGGGGVVGIGENNIRTNEAFVSGSGNIIN